MNPLDLKKLKQAISAPQVIMVLFLLPHFIAILFQVRKWPLTDYPMFSQALAPFQFLETIQIESFHADRWWRWSRPQMGTQASHDIRLKAYLRSLENPSLDALVREKAKSYYGTSQIRIRIMKVRLDWDEHGVKRSEQILKELPILAESEL